VFFLGLRTQSLFFYDKEFSMFKKGFMVLLLVALVSAGLFAQEQSASAKPNWVSGEASLLGGGARYERMLTPKISIGANVYFSTLFLIWNELEVGGSFRFYPTGSAFFVGGGLGFHIHTGDMNYTYSYGGNSYTGRWFGSITGVAISPEIGWKFLVGSNRVLFLQPGIKLPITFGVKSMDVYMSKDEFGVGIGIVPYFGIGAAF
jgi:hypothetical protein